MAQFGAMVRPEEARALEELIGIANPPGGPRTERGFRAEGGSVIELSARGSGIDSLPDSFRALRRLERLDLSKNGLASIPAAIGDLARLVDLRLDDNRLASLPDEIGGLADLKE